MTQPAVGPGWGDTEANCDLVDGASLGVEPVGRPSQVVAVPAVS